MSDFVVMGFFSDFFFFFYAPVGCLYVFFGEMSIHDFCPFFNWIVGLFIYLFIVFLPFLGLLLQYMEVPKLGV